MAQGDAPPPPTNTNALIDEASPYLLQHAHNPVDWRPWGEAAFDEARRREVPIFLSIGYSTCYWCHVMERQVFENPQLARSLNERFVCIKVDREQRPDVDELYMTATQLITRRGGWPMSVFLTPPPETTSAGAEAASGGESAGPPPGGLKPFWAGTYIPPEPMQGMAGFGQVLDAVAEAWANQRDQVLEQADQVAQAVGEHLAQAVEPGALEASIIQDAAGQLLHTYDPEQGGFGQAPKFPQPTNLMFLMAVYQNNRVDQVRAAITHTLDRMAMGGVYDQVGGGFHRYATDARWRVPHFEKMLYDNGQLLEAYAGAYQRLAQPGGDEAARYARVMRETAGYIMGEMTDPSGAFWSAQDAEVRAREGENYLWTPQQVREALGGEDDRAQLAQRLYGLDLGPNFRDPHDPHAQPANVAYLPRPLAELAAERGMELEALEASRERINAMLKAARDRREQPATDDKVLTGWNGLMIAGLARAGGALGEAKYIDAGARAARAVLEHLADPEDPGAMRRVMRGGRASVPALLEDYAMFAHGLIELHRVRPGAGYLDRAVDCVNAAADRFAADRGGYYDTPPGRTDLFARGRGVADGAVPGGNSVMAHNLLDLHQLTGDRAWLQRAARDLRSFADPLARMPLRSVHLAHAVLRLLEADSSLAAAEADAPAAPGKGEAPGAGSAVTAALEPAELAPLTEPTVVTLTLEIAPGLHLAVGAGEAEDRRPKDETAAAAEDADAAADEPAAGARGQALTIEATDPAAYRVQVDWPPPVRRRSPLSEQEVDVYEGRVVLPVRLTPLGSPADPPRLRVRYRACSEASCFSPHALELPAR